MTAIAAPNQRWVFGPIPDLLLGCGLGYVLLISLLPLLPVDAQMLVTLGTFGTLLIGAPHYGATLLRVYASPVDRRKYAFFAIYLSAMVWLWFGVGLYDLGVGSAMITLYLTWSPFHYTGQNYGLAVMFLRRREVAFSERTKKLLYASFMLSFVLVFVSLHRALGGAGAANYGIGNFAGTPFHFIQLGLPVGFWKLAFVVVGAAYIGVTLATIRALLRSARFADLVPVVALMIAQALWFSLPELWIWMTKTTLQTQGVGWLFVWAVLGHSAQYLWITTYYAVGREGGIRRWRYLFATLGAGSAIWTIPALVFSPLVFGTHPYNMGLFLMIAAAVNLHHFILDGAIWKLRDSGVGAILLAQPSAEHVSALGPAPHRPWIAAGGWTTAALLTALSFYGMAERINWTSSVNRSDGERAIRSAERLRWIGRADPHLDMFDGLVALRAGELDASLAAYQESLDLYPTPEAYFALAVVHMSRSETALAERALRNCLEMDPEHGKAHRLLGRQLSSRGEFEAGLHHLTMAARLMPADSAVKNELEAVRASQGRPKAP